MKAKLSLKLIQTVPFTYVRIHFIIVVAVTACHSLAASRKQRVKKVILLFDF